MNRILRGAKVHSRQPKKAAAPSEPIEEGALETRLGVVRFALSARGLVAVSLPGEPADRFAARIAELAPGGARNAGTSGAFRRASRELAEYFAGTRTRFDAPIDLRVTPFTRRVLEALARVPFGETRSYGALAKAIGSPRAARAVGTALSRNPIPIVLACHRVVAGNGALGGFAGKERKLDVKRALLELERDGGTTD